MEASALNHSAAPAGLRAPTPLLRLQSDERLVALVRRGNQGAFEALVARYQSRLLAFCRHMLSSREDAEDVLQEVFAAAYNAMLADERPINVRPWLYRIARNRSLNHLRRHTAIGVDSMDVHLSEHGQTTADKAHKREEFRQLVADVQELPETQRTALLLREIDALPYEQIAEAMETTVPSIKSLLVRARVGLAEMAEARTLTCEEVREELGEVAEGLRRTSPPVRRHLKSCERCAAFRIQLRSTNKALASVFPVAPLLLVKKLVLAHLGTTAGASSAAAGAAAGTAAGGAAAGGAGLVSAGVSAVASKTAAGLAAAAIVTAGAVEVRKAQRPSPHPPATAAIAPQPAPVPAPDPPVVTPAAAKPPAAATTVPVERPAAEKPEPKPAEPEAVPAAVVTPPAPEGAVAPVATAPTDPVAPPAAGTTEQGGDSTRLPAPNREVASGGVSAPPEQEGQAPAQQQTTQQQSTQPQSSAEPQPAPEQPASAPTGGVAAPVQ